jgi:TolB-like protein/tetratricopeptide (TPR) repeat protein
VLGRRLAFGPFVLNPEAGTLLRKGVPIPVPYRASLLLTAFLNRPGEVLTKSDLIDAAWQGAAVEEGNLAVQIAALRKLLGQSPEGGEWIITVPRVGYRFAVRLDPFSDEPSLDAPDGGEETALAGRPSIAVLPFTNVGGDKEQEYFADGITEDIITALGRFRWFFVISRNSSFVYKDKSLDPKQIARELGVQYLMEGSVRKSGQAVRISARLVQATTGAQIWAERYDLAVTEVFAIQDEIAERVVGEIEPELLKTESNLAAARHTGNMTAWDLVRQGTWRFHQVTRPTHFQARELFREACRLDPQLPEAHIWRARVSNGLISYGWSDDPSADLQEALQAALRAIYLDEKNPYAHYTLAMASIFSSAEQAILPAEKVVELSPGFALGHFAVGMARLSSGRASDAIGPFQRGLQLSPHDPQNLAWFNLLATAQLIAGDTEGALLTTTRAQAVRPDWPPTLETMACCYAASAKWEDARRCVREMARLKGPSSFSLAALRERIPQWRDQMSDLLRKAGWTEQSIVVP